MLRQLGVVLCLVLISASDASAHPGLSVDLAAVNRKLAERPGDVELLLARATIYRQKGQLQSALADLNRVAQLAPKRRELFLERGLTLAALGRSAAAELDLTRYLDTGAPTSAALMARGAIREASKRWALARADFDAATRLNPDAESFLARGRADEALGDLARAAAGYEEALKALNGAVVIRLSLIRVESARGHHDRALALVDEVLSLAPMKAEWLLRRADVHAAAGRAELAERDRTAALDEVEQQLKRRPNDLARLLRARAYLALGRKAEAIADLEQILKSSPRLDEARVLLSQIRTKPDSRRGTR